MKKKPIKATRSLSLDKETILKLDNDQVNEVAGGKTTGSCKGILPVDQDVENVNYCIACSNLQFN